MISRFQSLLFKLNLYRYAVAAKEQQLLDRYKFTSTPVDRVGRLRGGNNGGAGTSRGQQRTQPAAEDAGARSRLRRLKLERPLIYPEGDPEAGGCTS